MFNGGVGNGWWSELLYCLAKEWHIFFCNWTCVQELGLLDPEDQGTMIV
jgi:hypothetical protein